MGYVAILTQSGDAVLAQGSAPTVYGMKFCPSRTMVNPDQASLASGALNASGVRIAWAFQAQTADPITHIGFLTGTVTGAQPIYRGSLQSLDGSGNPDNTVLGGGSPASTTFTLAGSTWYWQALANAYTPTKAQWLSGVVDYSSGTIGGSNFANIAYVSNSGSFLHPAADTGAPYGLIYNGTSWSKLTTTPFFGIRTANTRYGNPITAIGQTSSISTSGHRTVTKFRIPAGGLIATYTITRMRVFIDWPNSGSDIVFGLWNAAGTALQSDTHPRVNASSTGTTYVDIEFSSPATLTAGTWYYAGVQAAGTTLALYCQKVAESADKQAYNSIDAGGATWNGSAWTDDDLALPAVELTVGEISTDLGPSTGGGRRPRARYLGAS